MFIIKKLANSKLYLQIGGVAMGSPFGPTFANTYMADREQCFGKDKCNTIISYVQNKSWKFYAEEKEKNSCSIIYIWIHKAFFNNLII